jgi:hypothetical protein
MTNRELSSVDIQLISLNRFLFVMKAIAADDLWDEMAAHLADHGHNTIMISSTQLALVQEVIKEKLAAGEPLSKRSQRFASSQMCGGLPPPKFPQPPRPLQPPPPPPEPPPAPSPGDDDDDDDDNPLKDKV